MKRTIPIVFLLFGLVACDLLSPPVSGPTVTSTSPSNGAQGVPVDTDITAQLKLADGDIDEGTLGNSTVKLTEAGSDILLSGDVSTSGDTITFDPNSDLKSETSYTFEVTNKVLDENGKAVRSYKISFTTAEIVDPTVPRIVGVRPTDSETNVSLSVGIGTDLYLPNGGVNEDTFTTTTVTLTNEETGEAVSARRSTTGGNDSITLQPTQSLEPNTTYRFEITSGVEDLSGASFAPFSSTFTTGSGNGGSSSDIRFEQVVVTPDGDTNQYSSLAVGPDRKLYASTIDGRIVRFPIESDGTLGAAETLNSLVENGPRLLIGLAFDPAATASDLIVWVGHTTFGFDGVEEPFGGKITRLSGPNLEDVQDYVVNLPRSFKDHVTNSVAFKSGDSSALYFNQGSNTAMGAPDIAWGGKSETLLSAATLRLDIDEANSRTLPIDVKTEDGGSYNPFASDAPLTIYGRGIRNAYDLVWHSNGNLYVPVNGSAGGGVVPRYDPIPGTCETRPSGSYTGPILDEPSDVSQNLYRTKDGNPDNENVTPVDTDGWKNNQTQDDFLVKVEEDGYYGHPNPKRCEWILTGGGDYEDDSMTVDIYQDSTDADPNYRGIAYNFEKNKSPNGVIEYQSDAFEGALKGKLLVTRYSLGDDVIALTLGSDGNVVSEEVPSGLNGFVDPLDLVEDTTNGNIYVAEFDEGGEETEDEGPKITLLRPN